MPEVINTQDQDITEGISDLFFLLLADGLINVDIPC